MLRAEILPQKGPGPDLMKLWRFVLERQLEKASKRSILRSGLAPRKGLGFRLPFCKGFYRV